jgi:Holliday junction resolvase
MFKSVKENEEKMGIGEKKMSYRKGYRIEDLASDIMFTSRGAKCVRSGGSHGVADLICGNGETVYVVQVKGGTKLPYIDWEELERFAKLFKGVPILLYKPDYRPFIACYCKEDLEELREYIRDLRKEKNAVPKMRLP